MSKILLVDDNVDMLDTLEHLFTFYEYEVLRAENGKVGLEIAATKLPGLIILDALMPVMNGFETCEHLKKNRKTKNIPVIFLSANYTEHEHRMKGLGLGADDYMLKPFNAKELITKAGVLLHRKKLIDQLRHDNSTLLSSSRTAVSAAATVEVMLPDNNPEIDSLTGLYNALQFNQRYVKSLEKAAASQREIAMLALDIDHFHRINDFYGEHTGDYVLMKIANVILQNTPAANNVFRISKNRFYIILPGVSETEASQCGERIRTAICHTPFIDEELFLFKRQSSRRKPEEANVTVSIGVSSSAYAQSHEQLLEHAEAALRGAKTTGRNNTKRHSELNN